MTILSDRLRRALEFDQKSIVEACFKRHGKCTYRMEGFLDGSRSEHARTAKLIEALVGCISADSDETWSTALAAVVSALEEVEK